MAFHPPHSENGAPEPRGRPFALHAIGARVEKIRFTRPDTLLFSTRVGTPHTTNNIPRQLRDVMNQAGVPDVAPHRFRRTAATAINEIGGLQLASELLGHSDPSITREHYIRRNETVNPVTAEFLERAFGRGGLSATGRQPVLSS